MGENVVMVTQHDRYIYVKIKQQIYSDRSYLNTKNILYL